jgi:tetratricopeptide (TPR) repeat protein
MLFRESSAIDAGLELHRRGLLAEAAQIYQSVLVRQPEVADALHLLGVVAYQRGESSRACELIGLAIDLNPSVAAYHANLAEALRSLGHCEKAVECGRIALALEPNFPTAANGLGLSFQAVGQVEAAIGQFREAIRLQSDFSLAYNNLGLALCAQGRWSEAVTCYRRALEIHPDEADAQFNLGLLLLERGRAAEALEPCREAVRLRPDRALAHNNLGRVLRELGAFAEAQACYAEALRLDPESARICNNLGRLLFDVGDVDGSLTWLRRSLELDPGYAPAHCNLGIIEESRGDFGAARCRFRAAIRHGPEDTEAHLRLARLDGADLPDADLHALTELLSAADLPVGKQADLHFGLAHVLDARGDFSGAARHLGSANASCKRVWDDLGKGYDPAEHRHLIEGMIATCTAPFFERVRGHGLETERPVFIVGLPRSGTTLAEQILASHSGIATAGELPFVQGGFESLPRVMNTSAAAVECLGRIDREAATHCARDYLSHLDGLDRTASRVVDKQPENYLYLGFLAVLFPRARFILCRRDLRDVAVSCWMTPFQDYRWANDLEHIASRIQDHERIVEHWRRVLPLPWLELRYEELVASPEEVSRRLIAWCGLEWQPQCLDFYKSTRVVRSASAYQVRHPISARSVGRWKNYAPALADLFDRLPRP